MTYQLINGPGPQPIDWFLENTSGLVLAPGTAVMWDTASTKVYDGFPLGNGEPTPLPTAITIYGVTPTTAETDRCIGITVGETDIGGTARVRVFGFCAARVAETASAVTLAAYGIGATDGQLANVAPNGTTVECYACQMGTSGTTVAGDLRTVFVDTRPWDPVAAVIAYTTRIFGSWT